MHTTQNDYTNLKSDAEAMNRAKDTHRKAMQELQKSTIYSEKEKSRRMAELNANEQRASIAALESFDRHLDTLKTHILEDMKEWPNANSPALSIVMSMINMKQQPDASMIKPFIGDIVTMNSLSGMLKAANLDDVAEPYTLNEYDLEMTMQRAYGAMSNARGADFAYAGNAAARIVSKIAPITGHTLDMTPSDEEQVAGAFRAAGLQP